MFLGSHDLTIDAKNRLSIPYGVRDRLNAERDGKSFVVLPGSRANTLMVYPDKAFERARSTGRPLEMAPPELYEWRLFELSQSAVLEPDSQGRVTIPERLLKRAGLGREVTLLGVADHLELWDRAAYEKYLDVEWPMYPQRRAAGVEKQKELEQAEAANASAAAAIG